jgi:lysyl-tRNA synthetase class 2
MTELSDLERQRHLKLQRIRERGIEPYHPRVERTHTKAETRVGFEKAQEEEALIVKVVGRLMSMRVMGKSTFAHIEDDSGRIQIYLRQNVLGEEEYEFFKRDFDIGDFVSVEGRLFRTRTGEVTVEVQRFYMLAKSLKPLPEKWHGLRDVETRYRQRYVDLIVNQDVRRVFTTRARIISAMRRFFDERGFLEVETPILQPLYGGAMARPFTTYHNQLHQTLYLRIATELYLKRLIVGGYERVYEIGKDFRNEGVDQEHNPEFTAIEFYMAYADYNDVMDLTEEMVAYVAQEVLGTLQINYEGNEIDLTPPWLRIPLRQAIKEKTGIDYKEHPGAESLSHAIREIGGDVEPQALWGKLVDSLLKNYVRPTLIQPTFLMDYPIEISPLAKKRPDDPGTVDRFQGYIGGMEVCNAFTELNDPIDQRERFLAQVRAFDAGDEEAHQMDEDFVRALSCGMPPTGGWGMGVDRLVMLFTNQASIRDVILFPHLRAKE